MFLLARFPNSFAALKRLPGPLNASCNQNFKFLLTIKFLIQKHSLNAAQVMVVSRTRLEPRYLDSACSVLPLTGQVVNILCLNFLIPVSNGTVLLSYVRLLSRVFVVSDSAAPCIVDHRAPLFMEFSRQEHWIAISFRSS